MKIKFLPFLNDDDGKEWLNNIKQEFEKNNADITSEINNLRNKKPQILKDYDEKYKNTSPQERPSILNEKERVSTPEVVEYYQKLREVKEKRQKMWIDYLMGKVKEVYDKKLEELNDKEKDKNETTIVAALPEFFWCDINDNNKHTDSSDIYNYQKPLYENIIKSSFIQTNKLSELTDEYTNLIFFAGTAKWKKPVNDNRSQEIIYNMLFIYHSGNISKAWGKHHFSGIDGFTYVGYNPSTRKYEYIDTKNKKGESKDATPPFVTFNGIDFAFDICLDFTTGADEKTGGPLSKDLCGNNLKNPINVLIAGGMPIIINNKAINQINNMNSDVILRCDANKDRRCCRAEIYNRKDQKNPLSGKTDNEFIGNLEIDI